MSTDLEPTEKDMADELQALLKRIGENPLGWCVDGRVVVLNLEEILRLKASYFGVALHEALHSLLMDHGTIQEWEKLAIILESLLLTIRKTHTETTSIPESENKIESSKKDDNA